MAGVTQVTPGVTQGPGHTEQVGQEPPQNVPEPPPRAEPSLALPLTHCQGCREQAKGSLKAACFTLASSTYSI